MTAPVVYLAAITLPAVSALLRWVWISEDRPAHGDAGIGALTVRHLQAQMSAEASTARLFQPIV